jgi:hypothetical protein
MAPPLVLFEKNRTFAIFNVGALRETPDNDGTQTINVSHLPKGVYFLKIGDKRGKFVKE